MKNLLILISIILLFIFIFSSCMNKKEISASNVNLMSYNTSVLINTDTMENTTYEINQSELINTDTTENTTNKIYQRGERIDDYVSYYIYEDKELEFLFEPISDENKLMSRTEFFQKIKESPNVDSSFLISFDELIKIVGKPQRELLQFDKITAYRRYEPYGRGRVFEWDLKDGETCLFLVFLSNDCNDEDVTPDNILEYGAVFYDNIGDLGLKDGDTLEIHLKKHNSN